MRWRIAISWPLPFFLVILNRVCVTPSTAQQVNATINDDYSSLSLLITVPLTSNGTHVADPGWMHYVSALLAVDHFNDRDPVVVPQLKDLDCDITFSTIKVLDTGTSSHMAMRSVVKHMEAGGKLDAIAGAFNELPARELSVLATGMEIPMVAHRGVDHNLVQPDKHPYYTQLNADIYGEMDFLADYLWHTGRTNFIAVLYSSEDSVLQRIEVLRAVLRSKLGADQVEIFSYISASKPLLMTPDRTIGEAMKMIKKTGFRTIILVTATPGEDNPSMSQAAAELQMDQGDRFYVISGGIEPSSLNKDALLKDAQIAVSNGGWLRGAAFTYQIEPWEVREDTFKSSFLGQNASFVQKLREYNPVPNYFDSLWPALAKEEYNVRVSNESFPPDNIFEILTHAAQGSTYMYDAVMSIGLGACVASSDQSTRFSGASHLEGIRSSEFLGASGEVKFGQREGTPGSRVGSTVYFGIINLLADGMDGELGVLSDYFDPREKKWVELRKFVYADGTTDPPLPLRDTPDQNYLSVGARTFGLILMGMSLFTVFVSAVWVVANRGHAVVVAAQPPFLYGLFFGATVMSFVIFCFSFDESYGWDGAQLSRACVAVPWLACTGDMIVYSALFTKLWRVNKVLQFKRRQIKISQVVWPAALVIVAAVIILSIWTATGDFGWERIEIDSLSGESIGQCKGDTTIYFLIPVLVLALIPTLLTCVMAHKTSDVDDLYSESKWIFTLVCVQVQVIVVGLPVVALLQDVSTDGRYIGTALLVWTMPMTTMILIMGPKMLAVRKARRNRNNVQGSTSKRGSSEGTRVTGITSPSNPTSVVPSCQQSAIGNQTTPGGVDNSRVQTVTLE